MPAQPTARLLVVDDEVTLMTALRDILRDEGYRVRGVTSGEEALSALREGDYDLVLADLMMPKMNGIGLLQEAFAIHPHLAAIIMTGHGSIPTAVEAMRTGAIDYVLKPIRMNVLLPALERALAMRRLRIENAELAERVRERTEELEAANKDLEAFSSSISHDLRTPLRTISGFTEILIEHHADVLPADVRRLVGLIQSGAGEMARMINGLLSFSQFGRQALFPETVDIGQVCRDAFEGLQRERSGRRVDLELPPLPPVYADPLLLRHVVANLMANAVKYSRPRDPARIEIGTVAGKAGVAPVYFIRDNGVGFDMRHVERLFGMFQRLHRASEFEGTGVGLATVRRIIERHGGRIWAEAEPSAGATFYFTLPPGPATSPGL